MPITKVHEKAKLFLAESEIRDAEVVHSACCMDEENIISGLDFIDVEGSVYCVHWLLESEGKSYYDTKAVALDRLEEEPLVRIHKAVKRRAMVWQEK